MRVVIQRVSEASVEINEKIVGQIECGLLILVGVDKDDSDEDLEWLSQKIVGLRIFSDEEGKMNKSIVDINGAILVVSQFTLHASTKKGNRPSFLNAAKPEIAIPIYEKFKSEIERLIGKKTECGQFGADMKIKLINDGPVTIIIDSKNKE